VKYQMLPSNALPTTSFERVQRVVDLTKSKNLVEKVSQNKVKLPAKLEELEKEDSFTSTLSFNAAVELNLPIASLKSTSHQHVVVQDYLRYSDIIDGDQQIRWGVGVRWTINFSTVNAEANVSSVPMIVASAQFGLVRAEARFTVLGLSSQEITNITPTPTSLDADSYAEYSNALSDIKNLMWDHNTLVQPQVIGLLAAERGAKLRVEYQNAIALTFALLAISQGDSLNSALQACSHENDEYKNTVESVYRECCENIDENSPREKDAMIAKELLGQNQLIQKKKKRFWER